MFLVLVQMLDLVVVQLVTSRVLFVVMVVMHMTAFVMILHVVHMVFVLMGMLMAGWVNVLVVLVMFHGMPHFL